MENDSRYPYTYACDLVRHFAGFQEDGTKISRADASQIIKGFSKVLNLSEHKVACLLADYLKENEAMKNHAQQITPYS